MGIVLVVVGAYLMLHSFTLIGAVLIVVGILG